MKTKEKLAELEARYYSDLQFPPTWINTGVEGLKQDVNSSRREKSYQDHKWGFQKGYSASQLESEKREAVLKECLEYYMKHSEPVFHEYVGEYPAGGYMQALGDWNVAESALQKYNELKTKGE